MAGFDNDVVYGTNVDFSGTSPVGATITLDGELLIGSSVLPNIRVGTLSSSDGSVTITNGNGTIDLSASGASSITYRTDVGNAVPAAGLLFILGGSNLGTTGGGNTVTVNLDDTVSISGSFTAGTTSGDITVSNGNFNLPAAGTYTPGTDGIIFLNSNRYIHSTGNFGNLFVGQLSGNLSTTGSNSNVGIGDETLKNINLNSANYNTAIGAFCQTSLVNGGYNVSVGNQTLEDNSSGQYNTAIGTYGMQHVTGSQNTGIGYDVLERCGTQNTAIGYRAGLNYNGTENSNVLVAHDGVASESNAMHLGTQGTGSGQIDKTTIAGEITTASGRIVKTTAPGAYPYTTLYTDYVIWVDTSSARTINLIASPATGRTYRIKDIVGSAGSNNITITPAAGNIDGAASYAIGVNYGSVDVVYNGSSWSVL